MTLLAEPSSTTDGTSPAPPIGGPPSPSAASAPIGPTADSDRADGAELEDWETEPPLPPLRLGLVVGCSTVGAAVMTGSVFEGAAGRIYPAIAGLCGIAVAAQASRRKSVLATNLTIVLGVVAIGIVLILPTGLDNLTRLYPLLQEAKGASKTLRPPTEFLPGFRLILGWLMACVGFTAGWVAIELRRPALGLLVPLPLIAMGAISVPEESKLVAGLVAVVLFILGLALLSSTRDLHADGEGAPGLGYELRRALKALPLVVVIVVVTLALSRSSFLFPAPLYDPTKESQRPRAVPLSAVEDRVLFEVRSKSTGPWRIGILDVYDGTDWRLPAFSESTLEPVPDSGVVDPDLEPGTQATFRVAGLSGAVLPGLPGTVGILAEGPRLTFDRRTGSIRLAQGQIRAGLQYTVTAAVLPDEAALQSVGTDVAEPLLRFTEMPEPPPAVAALLAKAPADNLWDRLQFVRRHFLETVVATGAGTPVAVPPSRIQDMLDGSKEGSPFEIVAAQAMLARWVGVPARIGYGYDGGVAAGTGVHEVRPKHGASWLEVNFEGAGWFPLIGSPLQARASLSPDGPTLEDASVLPSDDIAVQVYFPLRTEPGSLLYRQVQRLVVLALPLLFAGLAVYVLWPVLRKAVRRSRRRAWAAEQGFSAEVAQAYAELRDLCTDLGVAGQADTPLAFLDRVVHDREHGELAWLMTRTMWGDLRHDVTAEHAGDAVELSRALRKRLVQAQPATLRAIAMVSRLSLRDPHSPELAVPTHKERRAQIAS